MEEDVVVRLSDWLSCEAVKFFRHFLRVTREVFSAMGGWLVAFRGLKS